MRDLLTNQLAKNNKETYKYLMFKMGPWEIVLIVVAILIIFGPKRLPELGRGIGQFFKNFKKGISGENSESDKNPDKK